MKREPTPVDPRQAHTRDVWPTRPWFFWKKCCKCGIEFRREWGWFVWSFRTRCYVCGDCAGSPQEAEKAAMTSRPNPLTFETTFTPGPKP